MDFGEVYFNVQGQMNGEISSQLELKKQTLAQEQDRIKLIETEYNSLQLNHELVKNEITKTEHLASKLYEDLKTAKIKELGIEEKIRQVGQATQVKREYCLRYEAKLEEFEKNFEQELLKILQDMPKFIELNFLKDSLLKKKESLLSELNGIDEEQLETEIQNMKIQNENLNESVKILNEKIALVESELKSLEEVKSQKLGRKDENYLMVQQKIEIQKEIDYLNTLHDEKIRLQEDIQSLEAKLGFDFK